VSAAKRATKSARDALRARLVPDWWSDAKLGIFIHWVPASIPGFAPTGHDMVEADSVRDPRGFAESPYTEWYENSLRFEGSSAAKHHEAVYGDLPFRAFAPMWEAGLTSWDPHDWARRFAATGARYVVLVSKHMDGYCLWPSTVPNPRRPGFHSARDVVGELADAVRAAGLRFGLYYSGGFDSTWNDHPIGSFGDIPQAVPRGDYPAYAAAQVRELIERYRPDVLWNDICWPGSTADLAALLTDYYDAVPDGVINDRFLCWSPLWTAARSKLVRRLVNDAAAKAAAKDRGLVPPKPSFFDVRTPEYTTYDKIQTTPWECVRGMDHSFGYNRMSGPDDFITREDLLWSLSDIVAKGGNLLLNVGPRGEDAQIPEPQGERLAWLSSFTDAAGEALFGTRPWRTAEGSTAEGAELRYTASGDTVHALVRGPAEHPRALRCAEVQADAVTSRGLPLVCRRDGDATIVELDERLSPVVPRALTFTNAATPGAGASEPGAF
jgi:alpha-L-fucosidase